MSYPDYPNNRLIVDGVDLSITFGLVLLDGYTLSPPEPKTYTVDVPGGDGVIDLTQSLTGDVAYNNREQEFNFVVIDPQNFEQVKTKVSNFLHGKEFDYQITMDPDYTYHGRFTVTDYAHAKYSYPGIVGTFTVSVSAEPYKLKKKMSYSLNATGGKMFRLESGRKPVRPTIECTQPCTVTFKGNVFTVGAGTYRLNNVLFEEGWNEIYINSFRFYNIVWDQIDEGGEHESTWVDISSKRWDDIQRLEGDIYDAAQMWSDLQGLRWSEFSEKSWNDIDCRDEAVPDTTVYLTYEWKDL